MSCPLVSKLIFNSHFNLLLKAWVYFKTRCKISVSVI